MPSSNARPEDDWTRGPGAWAAIALISGLSAIGALSAVASSTTAPVRIESARINLNTATRAELQLLPRIGPALSQRIIEERQTNGPFADAEDLQRVKGVGPRTAARLAHAASFSGQH